MTGNDLKLGREQKRWTQQEAAIRLRVSQPYLSLMEKGLRPVPEHLARKAATAFGLPATSLPLKTSLESVPAKSGNSLAYDLASLGYPGLSYLKSRGKKNPAEVLLSALNSNDLEARLVEALPWILLKYPDVDWQPLVAAAKLRDLQNRLGFVTSLARRVAEERGEHSTAQLLLEQENALSRSRLFVEDTLCDEALTQAERRWLQTTRSEEAKYWRVLTDLSPEHLSHAY
jgi:transcriptional regulator with XRE-family HTH domain